MSRFAAWTQLQATVQGTVAMEEPRKCCGGITELLKKEEERGRWEREGERAACSCRQETAFSTSLSALVQGGRLLGSIPAWGGGADEKTQDSVEEQSQG